MMQNRLLILFILILVSSLYLSGLSYSANTPTILPEPKALIWKNFNVNIMNDWKIVSSNAREIQDVSEYLRYEIADRSGILLGVINKPVNELGKSIVLSLIKEGKVEDLLKSKGLLIPANLGREGYVLEVFSDCVLIVSNEPRGLFYGVQTLLQMMENNSSKITLRAAKITDFPNLEIRGVHLFSIDPNRAKPILDEMARLKMNMAIIHSGKYYNLEDGDNKQQFEDIFSYARSLYITPVPELQSFGVSADILNKDPQAAEGIWIKDKLCQFVNGQLIELEPMKGFLKNVIRSEDSNIVIRSFNGKMTYKENTDYYVETGDFSYPYLESARPAKIFTTPNSSIKNGEKVLISYDYVAVMSSETPWSIPYCPSSDRTYKVMFDTLRDVIYSLNPNYICIGHDEIKGMNRDSRCRKRNLSNAELLAEDVNKLNNFVKSINPNVRLLIWDDMFNPFHNGGDEDYQVKYGGVKGKTCDALNLISKDIIMMIWWYDNNDLTSKMKNSSDYFSSQGFDSMIVGYEGKDNVNTWYNIIKNRKRNRYFIITTWNGWDKNVDTVRYAANLMW